MERRPRAKVRPFFSLTGIWVMPRIWYSTGSSMVMILSSSVLISLDRGVQRGGLAAAGRPGDQHHAVGLGDVAPEFSQIIVVEAHHVERQLVELLAHRLFVEHAEHRVLAVNRRHDGHAEVDGALGIAVFHPETAVLGHAALGNVELAHHLDARNDGGMMLLADGRHGLGQHAVDAELDAYGIVAGLDVNVTGAPLQRGKDGGIDQADDRADVALRASAGRWRCCLRRRPRLPDPRPG